MKFTHLTPSNTIPKGLKRDWEIHILIDMCVMSCYIYSVDIYIYIYAIMNTREVNIRVD